MKSVFVLSFVLLMVVAAVPVNAVPTENEYGRVNAWFNGQEATVKNATLKIGEPAEIKVTVTSNISGNVYVKLTNPLVIEPYEVIEGTVIGEWIDNIGVSPSWSKTFIWKIKPNGAWKNGNAPINIFVSFSKKGDQRPIEFTIADPYIFDEQYSSTTSTSEETKTNVVTQTKTDSTQQLNTSSFPYIYLVLIGAAIILILVLFKLKK